MELSKDHFDADARLSGLAKNVNVLKHLKPLNAAEEKNRFLNGSIQNPDFTYIDPSYEVEGVDRLLEYDIPDDLAGKLLRGVRERLAAEHNIILNLGDEQIVREQSAALFGQPSPELVEEADRILREHDPEFTAPAKNLDANALVDHLNARFKKESLTNRWRAEVSDRVSVVMCSSSDQRIQVPTQGRYSQFALDGLEVHEVGIHAISRSENGSHQPLKVFSTGLMGYWETEEGLAVYAQQQTNTLSPLNMLAYAARVIAVDSVYKEMDFRTAFDRLMSYECFTPSKAYDHAFRAYRGGGYLKDLIYLKGLRNIERYAQEGGDLTPLFVGKVGLEQLNVIQQLMKADILVQPKHSPWFMDRLQPLAGASE